MRNALRWRHLLETLEARTVLAGAPIISEFLADNDNSITDANDRSADWIEIFNSGDGAIDLAGWHLTDDPSQLDKWTFPSTNLDASQYLVVFASGCDFVGIQCAAPERELHTNFRLRREGEYLALVKPDGETVVSQYGSASADYPAQYEDVSYGQLQQGQTDQWVAPDSTVQYLIPTDDTLGDRWMAASFDASDWNTGTGSLGYDRTNDSPIVDVLRLDFNDRNGDADDSESGFTPFTFSDSGSSIDGVTVSISAFGGATLDDRDRAVPEEAAPEFTYDQLYDDFIFANQTSGSPGLRIELSGLAANQQYNLKIRSYDSGSSRARVSTWTETLGNQLIVNDYSFDGLDRPADNESHTISASLVASSDGRMVIEAVRTGGTSHGVFINSLELTVPGLGDSIQTDVQSKMYQQATSLFSRFPFEVDQDSSPDELSLSVNYDAGFVAYLNGTEVARDNVPEGAGSLPHTASAVNEPSLSEALTGRSFDLSEHIDQLLPGQTNVLAIHALSAGNDDPDFLLAARLTAADSSSRALRYFSPPTPGAANQHGFPSVVSDTRFSHDRGFYDEPFTVEITSATPGATLIYTTDGSQPSSTNGIQVTDPAGGSPVARLPVTTTTYLRAMGVKDGHLPTNIDTHSYFFLDDVIRQDPLNDPNAPNYPTVWQANASADFEMDPDVVQQWDDNNPANDDIGIREALRSIPTISIVTQHDNLWGRNGIYRDATRRGTAYRHAASVEYLDPSTGEELQVDAGVQMHGNASRDNVRLKKHSFRLLFKDEYGPGSLRFPLFNDTDNETFNTIVLRAHFTDAFATRTATDRYSPMDSLYMRDVWMRNTQLAMGSLSTHNTYVHLYINGLYWGLYNPAERPDDAFLTQYLGGEREQWDIIKDFNELSRGNRRAWNEMFDLARDLEDAENPEAIYQRLQGRTPSGEADPDNPPLLDVDNLIDFMILHFYGGVEDWPHHNWYASRNRVTPGSGFRFYVWDQEIALDGRYRDLTGVGQSGNHRYTPAELYDLLRTHVDSFNLRFADRVERHFSEGGALSLAENQARWDQQAATIEAAIIAESARWGDAREGERIQVSSGERSIRVPTLTVDHWREEVANVRNNYMPRLATLTLEYFREAGLLSDIVPPRFNQTGGVVSRGFPLELSAFIEETIETKLLEEQSVARAFVPRDGTLDPVTEGEAPGWTDRNFDDSTWIQGTGGVGFEQGRGNGNTIGIDLLSPDLPAEMGMDRDQDERADAISFYSRFPFQIDDLADFDQLLLRIKFDDGFAAFLNGTHIVSENAPSPIAWDSRASGSHEASGFEEYDITQWGHLLQPGPNVLAIHGFNRTTTSNDLIVSPEIVAVRNESGRAADVYFTTDGSDPRNPDGSVADSAQRWSSAIPIDDTMVVNARGMADGQWGAIKSATFVVRPAGPGDLVISEINYHPAAVTRTEATALPDVQERDFEFVEIHNTHATESVSLSGLKLSDGVQFEFPDVALQPNSYAVVVSRAAAFPLRYGLDVPILGEWNGSLANDGERITISQADNRDVFSISYEDSGLWPTSPDGYGATLEWKSAAGTNRPTESYHWQASGSVHGSPGQTSSLPSAIRINEVLAHPDPAQGQAGDAIELHNRSAQAVDIGGWYLSDAIDQIHKYRIPDGTTIPAGGFWVIDQSQFNPTPEDPADNHFGLSRSNGDDLWLVQTDVDGQVERFIDEAHFGASRLGESLGRVEVSSGQVHFSAMPLSLGTTNHAPRRSTLVISEINAQPINPSPAAQTIDPEIAASDLEYLELYNPSSQVVTLSDWRLRGGVGFDFSNETIGPAATLLVVPFDPNNQTRRAAFLTHYGIANDTPVVGGYDRQLADQGERVRLLMPDDSLGAHVIDDEVAYHNVSPWPNVVDGWTLQRLAPSNYGNEPSSWMAATGSPGQFQPLAADFNVDGIIDASDIDLMCAALETDQLRFDLNSDKVIDDRDVALLLDDILNTVHGDANLDGRFDSSDLVAVFQAGKFETDQTGDAGWASGDWNCDGEFTTADLVTAFQRSSYQFNSRALANVATPRPSPSLVDLALARDDQASVHH